MPEEESFGAVVIGSGFGGTISALTLANYFSARATLEGGSASDKTRQVCLLERGQWWISHELPFRKDVKDREQTTDANTSNPNMREFLIDKGEPVGYWAHPDNARGLVDLALKDRFLNKTGLYDYRPIADDVHAIVASGVGGGSLVYSNVTLQPPKDVYDRWPTQGFDKNLEKYFDPARIFIGVDKITTLGGLGLKNAKLERSRIFQEAANKLRPGDVTNPPDSTSIDMNAKPDADLGFALDLAITDVQEQEIKGIAVSKGDLVSSPQDSVIEVLKDQNQQNVCQRQGRCVLGCLPGARHTLNKKIVKAMQGSGYLIVKALCEAVSIETTEQGLYRIHYKKYGKNGEIDDSGSGSITAKVLVLAAGTLGSTELLLRSKDKLNLSNDRLGHCFSTDGDLLGFMTLSGNGNVKQVDNTRGPINTCHALFEKNGTFSFSIEDTGIPKMVAPLFATMLTLYTETRKMGILARLRHSYSLIRHFGLAGLAIILLGFDIPRFQKAITGLLNNTDLIDLLGTFLGSSQMDIADQMLSPKFGAAVEAAARAVDWLSKDLENPLASPEERLSSFYIFSCMGIDKANGVLSIRPENEKAEDKIKEPLKLDYSIDDNREVFENIISGMKELAKKIDPEIDPDKSVLSPYWPTGSRKAANLFSMHPLGGIHSHVHGKTRPERSLFVLHPLGGCAMGKSPALGVVNSFGQVFDSSSPNGLYKGFYVLDGSIVPGALGVNSSLTIAALALRGVENLIGDLEEDAPKKLSSIDPNGKFDPQSFWPDFVLMQQLALVKKRQTQAGESEQKSQASKEEKDPKPPLIVA